MEGKGQTQLTGTVSHVIFQNKENGYTVLRLKTSQEEVTAVGILPQVTQGEQVILEGSWTDHPNFGRQFKAERAQRQMPSEKQGIYRYLASGVIKGIGPKLAAGEGVWRGDLFRPGVSAGAVGADERHFPEACH